MNKLTSFSKILILISFSVIAVVFCMTCNACLSGCGNRNNQGYYQQPQPVYQQPTVQYVQQPDGTSFMMDYLLYQALLKQGGNGAVNNYYNTHRNDPEFQPTQQQYYQQKYQVETHKSKGFTDNTPKPQQVPTQQSSGFSNNTQNLNGNGNLTPEKVTTQKSNGFTNNQPTRILQQPRQVETQRSSGFTNQAPKTQPVVTQRSSGFTNQAPKPTTTKKSGGFGKGN